MEKEICVITGCNSGIGKVTALQMAKQGYEVVMLVKNSEKSAMAFEDIIRESKSNNVRLEYVDLASIKSIKAAAKRISTTYNQIHVLINNAGIFKRSQEITEDGLEMTLAINYIAPFMLTNALLPLLENTPNATIINVGSEMASKGSANVKSNFNRPSFSGYKAYADSKLLLLYFTNELAKRLVHTSVTVNCVHPGFINTQIFRDYPRWVGVVFGWFIDSPEQGAKGTLNLVSNNALKYSGKYFVKDKMKLEVTELLNAELSEEIWSTTIRLLKAK